MDVLKKAKHIRILEYYLSDSDDDAETEEDEDCVDIDVKREMNWSTKVILDFVFSAPSFWGTLSNRRRRRLWSHL